MRFAYIDSNGNEVPIPSVDALALRIELGAINENTELYDAQADQWGPAHTHEIFHTLSRAAEEGDQGFVAPPPPVAPPPSAPQPEAAAEEPSVVDETPAVVESGSEEPATDPTDELTLADMAPTPDEPEPADAATVEEPAALETGGLDLAPTLAEPPVDEADPPPAEPAVVEEEPESPAFDFGDMEGGLELEEGAEGEDAEPAMDFSMGAGIGAEVDSADGADFGDGLEQPMDFSSEGFGGLDSGGALDLEQPMSEFSPDAPPAWMDQDEAAPGDEVMDFSSVTAEVAEGEAEDGDVPLRSRRTPRNKPSPPKHRRQRSLVGPIVGVVILLGVGVGGYVAWPILSARLAERGQPVQPAVELPAIPEELLPQMHSVAGAAFASALREARSGAGTAIASPPQDWLAGVYFGNASRYEGVETFWLGVRDVLDELRGLDLESFQEHYQRGMSSAGVSAADGPRLSERADAGFVAAASGRAQTFALVDRAVDSALGLHSFLLANEENIDYVPASSVTSDPVLEAKPATPEIGAALRDRLDRVTESLRALDYLDRVTADGFWAAVLSRLQEVGIQ